MRSFRLTRWHVLAASSTFLYVLLWAIWRVAIRDSIPPDSTAASLDTIGLIGLYALGLVWLVWGIERAAQHIEAKRAQGRSAADMLTGRRPSAQVPTSNPLDPEAWYYGRHSQRFRQSLALIGLYFLGCYALFLILHPSTAKGSSSEIAPFELPEGGGGDQLAGAPPVKIQKVVKPKRLLVNPYRRSIEFVVPDNAIDKVNPDLTELAKADERYKAGQGTSTEGDGTGSGTGLGSGPGTGGGFGAGTGKGKVRFIRLKHSDKAWDRNLNGGADRNLLKELVVRARWSPDKVAEDGEQVDFAQLAAFPERQAPPVIFVAGAQTFQLSRTEKDILKKYLLERNGMIFADNLGGQAFHNQFFATMREVTSASEVAIPRDDYIHRRPFPLPSLPIVVAHGGTVPYGWNVDGRWVVYYHPGAISDAWRDDHAGIKREIWNECYQLGINVLFYSLVERNKWLTAKKP